MMIEVLAADAGCKEWLASHALDGVPRRAITTWCLKMQGISSLLVHTHTHTCAYIHKEQVVLAQSQTNIISRKPSPTIDVHLICSDVSDVRPTNQRPAANRRVASGTNNVLVGVYYSLPDS